MPYPVQFHVEPPLGPRRRVSVAFRPVLALPHAVMVGGPAFGIIGSRYRMGALAMVAAVIALFDWLTIIFTGQPVERLQPLKRYYLQWRGRALAYMAFLRDEFPPLGEGEYPAQLELPALSGPRDRLTVGVRPILLIPQVFVVALLLLAWLIAAIVSWFELVITGSLSPALWRFGHHVVRYVLRVEAYGLFVHDQYPPFALTDPEEEHAPAAGREQPA
jgi:hypothetical protein